MHNQLNKHEPDILILELEFYIKKMSYTDSNSVFVLYSNSLYRLQ